MSGTYGIDGNLPPGHGNKPMIKGDISRENLNRIERLTTTVGDLDLGTINRAFKLPYEPGDTTYSKAGEIDLPGKKKITAFARKFFQAPFQAPPEAPNLGHHK